MVRSDYLILKRRAEEAEKMKFEVVCKTQQKLGATANWEIHTSNVIEKNRMMQRFNDIRAQDEVSLDARRKRLADMLAAEQQQFERELAALQETPAERNQRMGQRATELRNKRESERMDYVQQQYERQWRLACDPLREQDSKLILKATDAARAYQIGEKMRNLELEEAESRAFDELWEKDRLAKEGREEADAAARKQMEVAQKVVLDKQVRELQAFREEEKAYSMEMSELLKQQCSLERDEAKKVEALRAERLAKAQSELTALNSHKRALLVAEAEREKLEDEQRLTDALDAERTADEREHAAKVAMQQETRLFAEHMMAQKRESMLRESEQEAIRQGEIDKAWDKRLATWGEEQQARERLMAQVLEERKEQVMIKLRDAQNAKLNEADHRRRLESEVQRLDGLQAHKMDLAHKSRLEHKALLEHQMKERKFKHAAAEHNKLQERLAAERAEGRYQAMLGNQLEKTNAQMRMYST